MDLQYGHGHGRRMDMNMGPQHRHGNDKTGQLRQDSQDRTTVAGKDSCDRAGTLCMFENKGVFWVLYHWLTVES